MNPYRVLGLDPTATAAEIRDAYRRRAKLTHPDAGGSAVEFDRLTAAYDTLADPGRRFAYDRSVARDHATGGASMDEHRRFEAMWQPPERRRGRNSSRIGNLAVSLVGGAALAAAAIVLRFGGDSKPGPPTPVTCAAVRSVTATYVLVRAADGSVFPRVTVHNAGSELTGATVGFAVTVALSTPRHRAADQVRVFGPTDRPIWARSGHSATSDLTAVDGRPVVPGHDDVREVSARATASSTPGGATALPAAGCAIAVSAG